MNTSKTDLEIAREFAGLLRARTQAVREIILFGSVARGEATEESDIDVALVVTSKDAAVREIQLEAGEQIMNKHGALIGCVTYSLAEWEKARRFPFGAQVSKQGLKL
ncbi:MAG: nucleotidyltransferase domain-containing protein [Lentisphaerae bacterium]|nr:nucleotidyltransferase domain-containing protein [Lentisphaerota bacterium]